MKEKTTHGGTRKNAGRKKDANAPKVHGIRCTDAGWKWLQDQAKAAGKTSVGKWADGRAGK